MITFVESMFNMYEYFTLLGSVVCSTPQYAPDVYSLKFRCWLENKRNGRRHNQHHLYNMAASNLLDTIIWP
jgi:hypothetical protein